VAFFSPHKHLENAQKSTDAIVRGINTATTEATLTKFLTVAEILTFQSTFGL